MILPIIYIVLGAFLVVWGAGKMTDGASALARRCGVSEFVVGLTVVSVGTSLPEFVVSLLASINHSPDMSVGNVLGSNLFNILVIVGLCAMFCPISVSRTTITRDIPFVILSSLVLAVVSLDVLVDGSASNVITRVEGLTMLLFFAVFMFYTMAISGSGEESDAQPMPLWLSLLWIVVGIASLVGGGHLFVDGATDVAHALGVSELVIGMTIMAGGTSLPELAASLVAARKGRSAMAIGNVIGSNVFNVFFVLGLCCTVTPMEVENLSLADISMLVLSAFMFWFFARSHYAVRRWEGCVMFVAYVLYIIYKVCVA